MEKGKNTFVVFLFALLTVLLLGSNVIWVKKGDVLTDAILDETNPYLRMDAYVKEKTGMREPVRIALQTSGMYSTEADLKRAAKFHRRLEKDLPEMAVISVVNFPCFGVREEKPLTAICADTTAKLFLDQETIQYLIGRGEYLKRPARNVFNEMGWSSFVWSNPNVGGTLVGVGQSYLTFLVYPPKGMDERKVFELITMSLEQREIPGWEWLVKSDINPAERGTLVSGWTIGRGIIDGALNADLIKLIGLGLTLGAILLFLATKSVAKSLAVSLGVVLLGVLFTRGSIGLLDYLGFPIKERVYVLLAYTNCIVQGLSFSLHLLSTGGNISFWGAARKVSPLFVITTVISVFGFGTLYAFPIRAIQELGVVSAISVLYLFALSLAFLPAVLGLLGLKPAELSGAETGGFYRAVAMKCERILLSRSPRSQSISAFVITALALFFSIYLVLSGALKVESRPLEYVPGTIVERTANLAKSAYEGFDSLEVFVESNGGKSASDPEFLNESVSFLSELKKVDGVRNVFSLATSLDYALRMKNVSGQSEVEAILREDFSALGSARRELYGESGYRASVSSAADSSIHMRDVRSGIEAVAKRYPGLKVSFFGAVALYPEVDEAIVFGKPWNVISSQAFVVMFSLLWIIWLNRRFKGRAKLRPFGASLAMSVPFLFSSAVIILVMIVGRIPLDVATAAIGAMALNASIDFAIYFEETFQREISAGGSYEEALKKTFGSEAPVIVADALINMACFLPLVFSTFLPVARLGWMMLIMLSVACLASLLLMPPLLRLSIKPRVS